MNRKKGGKAKATQTRQSKVKAVDKAPPPYTNPKENARLTHAGSPPSGAKAKTKGRNGADLLPTPLACYSRQAGHTHTQTASEGRTTGSRRVTRTRKSRSQSLPVDEAAITPPSPRLQLTPCVRSSAGTVLQLGSAERKTRKEDAEEEGSIRRRPFAGRSGRCPSERATAAPRTRTVVSAFFCPQISSAERSHVAVSDFTCTEK